MSTMFHHEMKTQVIDDSFKCKWTLENFSRISSCTYHTSPVFRFADLTLFCTLHIKNGSMCIKLHEWKSYTDSDVFLQSQVFIVDSSDTIIHSESKDDTILISMRHEGCELITVSGANFKKLEQQSLNDLVILRIELTISKSVTKGIDYPIACPYIWSPEIQLGKDILKYDDNELTDVVLNVQGEKINAHKFILCARSSVFLKMFQQNMAESARNVVDIQDVGADAMKHLVDYMYSRVNGNYNFRTALDVYYAADKYQVPGLRKSCRKVLLGHIDENNAFQLLLLSDRHKAQVLKEGVMEYIYNNFKFCAMSEWWNDFVREKSDLFQELKTFVKDSNNELLAYFMKMFCL